MRTKIKDRKEPLLNHILSDKAKIRKKLQLFTLILKLLVRNLYP